MCVSNNAFELQAYEMSKKIQQNSIFQPVRIVYAGGKCVEIQENSPYTQTPELITKVILQDKRGNIFEVEPSENGLKFCKGEISYSEYLRRMKKENRQVFTYFSLITGSFFILGWAFIKYLT